MVCPWNQRFAAQEGDPSLAPRAGVPFPDLAVELALTPQEFNRKFKDSPVTRAKRKGYLRNVAVALGNVGDNETAAALDGGKFDDEPLIREHIRWALDKITGKR
jgi:epoxyqueuosine reductase